jgi:pilus assembly protein CpaD
MKGAVDLMIATDSISLAVAMRGQISVGRAVLTLGLLASFAGCSGPRAIPPPATPYDFRDRHPVVLADTPHIVDLFPTVMGGRVDYTTGGRIREFADHYRRFGYGPVILRRPVGSPGAKHIAATIPAVRRALTGGGLGARVDVEDYRVTDAKLAAPLRLSFSGVKARVSGRCGEWPNDLASGASLDGWQNETWWNYGCASQQTLAAQIADPRDLAGPRGETPADTLARMRSIDNIRDGKDPSTQWPKEEQAISKVGGQL